MNKFIAAIKKIRLGQIIMTFVVGVLLFVSTACNNGATQAKNAATPTIEGERQDVPAGKLAVPGRENPRPEVPGGTATSPSSDVINTFQRGGMNEFSDVDPRAKGFEKAAANKAQMLRENAEQNVIDETGDIGENTRRILDKKGENVDELGTNLQRNTETATEKAKGTAEDFARGTRRGTENIKENTADAVRGASRAADNAKDNTVDAAQGVKRAATNATDNTFDNAKGLTKGLSRNAEDVKESAKAVADKAQSATDNLPGFFQDKLNQAAKGSQRAIDQTARNTLNKAGNAINDTIDID